MSILRCETLTKEYQTGETKVLAIDNISTAFERGEFCAITGASGSGKSTLIHMLGGLEYPTSGQVFYQQEDLFNYSDDQLSVLRRRRFGFVFQAYNLVQELTALENMLLPVMLDKQKPEDDYLKRLLMFWA